MQGGPPGFAQIELIYKGTVATVFKAIHQETGEPVVLKVFKKIDLSEDERYDFEREVECHRNLDHPFIARFFGVAETETKQCIVMEYTGTDSLLSLLEMSGGVLEFTAEKLFAQLAAALFYLHVRWNISHRDIKLENLMLTKEGDLKLIDFGVSRKTSAFMSTCCGSLPYCAPEIFQGGEYTKAVDIWACGVCLFTLLAGQLPFEDENCGALAQKVLNEEPEYPSQISDQALDLLKQMLEKDPKKRITIEGIIDHPWLQTSQFVDAVTTRLFHDREFKTLQDTIDKDILRTMEQNGYRSEAVAIQVHGGVDNGATMIYRILRNRQRVLERQLCVKGLKACAGSAPQFGMTIKQSNSSVLDMLKGQQSQRLPTLTPAASRRVSLRSPKSNFAVPVVQHPNKFRIRSLSSAKNVQLLKTASAHFHV